MIYRDNFCKEYENFSIQLLIGEFGETFLFAFIGWFSLRIIVNEGRVTLEASWFSNPCNPSPRLLFKQVA